MRMDIRRISPATPKLLILRALHRAAGLPHIPQEGASAVAVTEADARLRYHRSFLNTRPFKDCATSLPRRLRVGGVSVNQIEAGEPQWIEQK